jgi:hypothetical protein
MTISKKQFDFAVRGRVCAIDPTAALILANLQVVIEGFSLEGVEYDLTTPSTVGAGNEIISFPTLVADNITPTTTAALAATATAVKAAIGTLKGLS